MRDLLKLYPRHHPESAGRVLDGEAVVVTPADSRMHTLNEVGTFLWDRADGARSVAELAEAVEARFEVDAQTARSDTAQFVADLEALGILVLDEAPGSPG